MEQKRPKATSFSVWSVLLTKLLLRTLQKPKIAQRVRKGVVITSQNVKKNREYVCTPKRKEEQRIGYYA